MKTLKEIRLLYQDPNEFVFEKPYIAEAKDVVKVGTVTDEAHT